MRVPAPLRDVPVGGICTGTVHMYNLDSRRLIDAKIIRLITRRAAALECFGHKPDGSLIDRPSQTVTDYERVR